MSKSKKLRVKNALYLNANILYGEVLNYIQKPEWKIKIKTQGTLNKLKKEGYCLVTSVLTRMEIVQRLRREQHKTSKEARSLYYTIIQDYTITEIAGLHHIMNLSDAFLDDISKRNIDFKDALHLKIAEILSIPVCTHDKKIRKGFSQHKDKEKYYSEVYKPEDLIKSKNLNRKGA
ncbi:MAG: hypothetical protein ABIJ18_05915 [archaeon]